MAPKKFLSKIQSSGNSSALLLTKKILGEDLFAPVGTELKVVRTDSCIKIYPLKKLPQAKEVKEGKKSKEVKE